MTRSVEPKASNKDAPKASNKEVLQQKVAALPSVPGVYLMKDATGEILYVGKASALSDRVRSYFQRGGLLPPRIRAMMARVADIEVITTGSDLEALILENNLIKRHRPRYNVVLRDDKNYPFLRLGIHDPYPRLEIVRRVQRDGALYYGPYVPTNALRETLRVIRKIFPLPNCTIEIDGTAERACIEYDIGRCLAPCTGQQGQKDYQAMIRQLRMFLEGRDRQLLRDLKERMRAEAEGERFEEAARLRDRIAKIERVLERQRITSTQIVDRDVIGLSRGNGAADVQILFVRRGMLIGRQDLFFASPDESDADLIAALIQQVYARETVIPKTILVPVVPTRGELLERWLSERRGGRVRLLVPARGPAAQLVRLAEENARQALEEHRRKEQTGRDEAEALRDLISLSETPGRIEAFDISNLQGDRAVGSMVVWEAARMKPADYRRFRIRMVAGPDDFAMLREVIGRRYRHAGAPTDPKWSDPPDLVVVDGGRGQLGAVLEALKEVGLAVPAVGLAKKRGERFERLYLPGAPTPLPLRPGAPETLLLQRIRDESHRFAVRYHRRLRGDEMRRSILDEVEGIGPARKRALLRRFGDPSRLAEASVEELSAAGIPRAVAERIRRRFSEGPRG